MVLTESKQLYSIYDIVKISLENMKGPNPTEIEQSMLNYWTYPGRTFVIAVINVNVGDAPTMTPFVFTPTGTKVQESITQSISFLLVKKL